MIPHQFYYQLVVLGLLWLFVMLHLAWPSRGVTTQTKPAKPITPRRQRSTDPKPFPGLIHKPHCAACEQVAQDPEAPSPPAPSLITSRRGRPRQVDTAQHFCPNANCDYRGWMDWGNISANGHPSGGPWRQLYCSACERYFLETHGMPFHGKRVAPDLLVWAVGALAEGLGIRAVARVFAVDPNTVLAWLLEVADHLKAFSQYFLRDVRVTQVQLDELYALLSAVKDGEVSAAEAIERLERSPQWVWVAMDPESKVLLALDVGERTLAMAQCVVHHVAQVVAPDCVPLFLTDGFREYLTALLTHFGHWVHPQRRQATGPLPKPRWMPRPQLLYAQVVKAYRRRRIVGVKHRVVFGTMDRVKQVLAACGWQINTAFVERLNLDLRQRVAAAGRRVNTLCQGEDGLRHQLTVFQAYHNFVLPHASLRQPLRVAKPTNGAGSARKWQPTTPAMAAGLTDHVWTLREVLRYRVPPWPQPQTL